MRNTYVTPSHLPLYCLGRLIVIWQIAIASILLHRKHFVFKSGFFVTRAAHPSSLQLTPTQAHGWTNLEPMFSSYSLMLQGLPLPSFNMLD